MEEERREKLVSVEEEEDEEVLPWDEDPEEDSPQTESPSGEGLRKEHSPEEPSPEEPSPEESSRVESSSKEILPEDAGKEEAASREEPREETASPGAPKEGTPQEQEPLKATPEKETVLEAEAAEEPSREETVPEAKTAEKAPHEEAASEETPRTEKRKIPFGRIAICVAVLILLGTGGFYFYRVQQYKTRFLPNTSINGINAEDLTVDEVKAAIEAGLDDYVLTLTENGGTSERITRSEIGLHTEFDESLDEILAAQKPLQWFQTRNIPKEYRIETSLAYDDALLDARIESLSVMDPANWTEPENAKISEYDMEANCYTIVPETAGTTIVPDTVKPVIAEAVLSGETEVDLGAEGCYTKAAITSDNPTLAAVAAELNTYAGAVINYTFGDTTEVFDGDVIHNWLSLDGTTVTLDESQAAVYVAELAEKYDTVGKPKKLMTSYGAEVEIDTGTYGWRIDQKKETEIVLEVVKNGEQRTKEPEYSQTAASHGETDYGDTYVEVNLFTQHLFFYKDGQLVIESDLVSGNEARKMGTPDGAYPVAYKQRNTVLRGPRRADGSYSYESPVSYWMPFNGGIGLHDASWRGRFGGTIYKTNGSHGCVNLPRTTARTIFENIERGDPVLCYRLDPATIPEPEPEEEKNEETGSATETSAQTTPAKSGSGKSAGTSASAKPAPAPTQPATQPAPAPTTPAAQPAPAPTTPAAQPETPAPTAPVVQPETPAPAESVLQPDVPAPAPEEPSAQETAPVTPEAPGDVSQEVQPSDTEPEPQAVPETTAPVIESGGDDENFGPGFVNVPPAAEEAVPEYGPGM